MTENEMSIEDDIELVAFSDADIDHDFAKEIGLQFDAREEPKSIFLSNDKAREMIIDANFEPVRPRNAKEKRAIKAIRERMLESALICYGARKLMRPELGQSYSVECDVCDRDYSRSYAEFRISKNGSQIVKVTAKPFRKLIVTHSPTVSQKELWLVMSVLETGLKSSAAEYELALVELGVIA